MTDPIIDEQASQMDIEEAWPEAPSHRPWREPERIVPEKEDDDKVWAGGEVTGIAGGGMPEAASQAEDPGTDTDISLPRVKKRIKLDA